MATYAVGDVQGCFESLQRLLERLAFRPGDDRLWLVGDLVNRGPDSLGVLRWAREHDGCVTAVLGNHDLHLLGAAAGTRSLRRRDTLAPVLEAPDRDELLAWLRARPLVHREDGRLLVHAGLAPAWTADDALAVAARCEAALQEGDGREALDALQQPAPPAWSDGLEGAERLAAGFGFLTRVRGVDADGRRLDEHKGPPAALPPGGVPWFDHPHRRSRDHTIVCGHWAALGLHLGDDVRALDSGCVWGQRLTALRLEDDAVVQVEAVEAPAG